MIAKQDEKDSGKDLAANIEKKAEKREETKKKAKMAGHHHVAHTHGHHAVNKGDQKPGHKKSKHSVHHKLH